MKLSLSLPALIVGAFSLCACNTLADRRSLYSPKKGDGYWTRTLHEGTWKSRGAKPVDTTVKKGGARSTQPIPPPPAPPGAPLPEAAPSAPLPAL